MSEINNLIEMLAKGGFRSACDWLCLKMDASRLRQLLEELKRADLAISDPEQKKLFEQGILAIQMSLDSKDTPGGGVEPGSNPVREINNLIEMLEKGGFRSACDWFCQKMDPSHLRHLLGEMKKADSTLSDPEQKKLFGQGILAIEMSLDSKEAPDGEAAAVKESMRVT